MRLSVLAVLLVLVAACGEGVSDEQPRSRATEYTTRATVLEGPKRGPQLCFFLLESMPPQCEGTDITNWSWAEADGEESANGTTWGDYTVHGTYADGAFTLTRKPAEPKEVEGTGIRSFTSPCPEPAGGWFPEGRTMIGMGDRSRALQVARKDPAFGEVWVDQRPIGEPTEENMNDPERLILNVRVTGDVAGVEARIRDVWGGALCVSVAKHTHDELKRITKQVNTRAGSLFLSSSWGDDRVDLDVLIDEDGALQKAFDADFGKGVVRVTSALKAVPPGV